MCHFWDARACALEEQTARRGLNNKHENSGAFSCAVIRYRYTDMDICPSSSSRIKVVSARESRVRAYIYICTIIINYNNYYYIYI